jgi:hypothetical protein
MWTAFESKLSVNVDACMVELASQHPRRNRRQTLFEENSLKQRILVPQHQTLISRLTMALLKTLQGIFMVLYGSFQLFDIFGSTFTKSRLRLTIPLLTLLRCGIDLEGVSRGWRRTVTEYLPAFVHPSFLG